MELKFKIKKSVTLDRKLVQKIQENAKSEGRSFSQMLNEIIKRYYESKGDENEK